jgi:CheY-like chemotaxis protein
MARVRLFHWNAEEAEERAARLRAFGHEVEAGAIDPAARRKLNANPPQAIVIDLSRLPMQGRDVAFALRQRKSMREVPIVFVGGDGDKLARIREQLPDAVYATWRGVGKALSRAIAKPPKVTAMPSSALAGYSGTPLPKKLGIAPGCTVALIGAPPEFERTLGELPADVKLRRSANGTPDLAIWFVRSRAELMREVRRKVPLAERRGLWIVWAKKTSPLATDVTETEVRELGLAAGLVDYKICAVDADWSGLRFAKRKPAAP